jgi:hypothetical protein
MPYGFFTVEKWVRKSPKTRPQWVAICHLEMGHNLSDAIQEIQNRGKPGFFRVIQTQRMIRAEKENGKLRLRRWHAGKPETLARSAEAFERDHGKRSASRGSKKKETR